MHKETINYVLCSPLTDYIITFSVDGHIKFWKKVFQLIEFAKNFKAHSGLITGASLSKNHDLLCSVGLDKTLKVFDVLNCDLRMSVKLNFVPSCCEFIPQEGKDWQLIAVSEEKTSKIYIIDPEAQEVSRKIEETEEVLEGEERGESDNKKDDLSYVINTVAFHRHPIKFIKMNWKYNFCISIDERSFIEIWNPNTFDFPTHLNYKCKIETDFLMLLQASSTPLSINLSPHGNLLAVMLKDKVIRIFSLKTGKLTHTISENIKDIIKIQ